MRRLKLDWTTITLSGVALVLAVVAWIRGGSELAIDGLVNSGQTLISVTPLLLAAFAVAGLIQVLIPQEMIDRWLGSRSGWRGILLACLGGALIPGGPYVYYPIAGALLQSGAGLGVLVAFVSAKNLWSITRLPYEFALLGTHLTMIRYIVTLIVPPVFGLVSETLFGKTVDSIREAVK
jgi:uncharacterized membrane protein YraQ (UPF0718 family)